MSKKDGTWTSAGWRTKMQIDTLRSILQHIREGRDRLYAGLCDRIKKGDAVAEQTYRGLLAKPLLGDQEHAHLRGAYTQACSPGNLPYGALAKDEQDNVKVMQFQHGLDGSFEPV
ncbi:hypothetical protein DOTSEDRAFT_22811 [Dothistroma septosporum NZE10]|uniref:Uncharacterized protein n=1 Tax=Dothistroma septosporum (strain NZE10 / CBS 128990) TaxID=675120 RepID=N1PTJ9_DOTSN|nr:hypothetical protein DOTSEDRAFT_22811 [Dothistroma septosporum NZE10]